VYRSKAPADAERLGLGANAPVIVESDYRELCCRVFIDEVAQGTVKAHSPEANVQIPLGPRDTDGDVPNYNACVSVRCAD
jgi:anaerobic selenocysteine-containing dehydrogenase